MRVLARRGASGLTWGGPQVVRGGGRSAGRVARLGAPPRRVRPDIYWAVLQPQLDLLLLVAGDSADHLHRERTARPSRSRATAQ